MWRSWTIGFLGAWTVFVVLVINPGSTQKVLLVFTGIVIAVISFSKVLSEHREEKFLSKEMETGTEVLTSNETENE